MIEKEFNKTEFFLQLKLQAVKPDEILDFEKRLLIPELSSTELKEKNDRIKTGYENFYLKKGNTKLYPFKDFDFIGKHVICQKCCQRFVSKTSYKVHIGTDICVKSFNGPNIVYVKHKYKNGRLGRKKYTYKPLRDFHHDIKKNLLNPAMLNTLQTRKNCYSDVVHQRVKHKEKRVNNAEPHVKKPRGRPRKNVEVEPRKQLKQLDSKRANTSNNSSLNNNLTEDETVLKKPVPVKSEIVVDAYYCNNKNGMQHIMSTSLKSLTNKFWKLFNQDWKQNLIALEIGEQNLKKEEGTNITPVMKNLNIGLEGLNNDLKILLKQFQGPYTQFIKVELEMMLSKLNEKLSELKLIEPKKTHMHSDSTTGEGKENMLDINYHRSIKNNEDETETNKDEENFGSDEKCSGIWVHGNINDNMSKVDEENSTIKDIFENKLETLTEDSTQNCTNSVQNHLINVYLNQIHCPTLECKTCEKKFATVGEWKMHCNRHVDVTSKTCLCKICGLKFKIYKNYVKHMNTHRRVKQINVNNDEEKMFKCKKCHKKYKFLALYYSHIKTHVNDS